MERAGCSCLVSSRGCGEGPAKYSQAWSAKNVTVSEQLCVQEASSLCPGRLRRAELESDVGTSTGVQGLVKATNGY